jgi:regulator of sirC expression with transglutaminase-like and TPR domain
VSVNSDIHHEFSAAIEGADRDVDLFGAAIAISRIGGHRVDPHSAAAELDRLAEAVLDEAGSGTPPHVLAQAIDHELFTIAGFSGNHSNYSEPANSYLDRVIRRRTGIPITLSLVYMEVAARVGLRCDGIGYPGHFIVRCGDPEEPIYIDPFQQGLRLDAEELLANLRSARLGGATPESFLAALTRRQILQRMLNNLHISFRERRDLPRWLTTVELLLVIEPWNAQLVGERGMLNYRLGNPEEALIDLERYVTAGEPQSVNAGARRLLDELRLRYGGSEELR